MSTQFPDLFARLAEPFGRLAKSRTQSGKTLHYITARSVMNRLDTVLGPENWWDEYRPGENSVLCRLTIRLPDGSTLTKSDAGGYAGMADSGDDDKSGYSDAFKRAAVKFGVGRELYGDGVADLRPAQSQAPTPHTRPTPHTPAPTAGSLGWVHGDAPDPAPGPAVVYRRGKGFAPQTGREFFAWAREREQEYEVALMKYVTGWAKLQRFPGRVIDWSNDQVRQAHAEAVRKLEASVSGNGQARGEAMAN